MSAPEAYPFLRIAKQYGLDYSDVLQSADALRGMAIGGECYVPIGVTVALCDINHANRQMSMMRQGLLDWQTGETRGV